MSKLEELIARLCPDGVEYKELGDICQLGSGGDIPKNRFSDIKTEQYNIPIYSNGIGNRALYGYTDIAKVDKACVTVSARGTIGWCALRNEPFYPIVRLIYIIPKDGLLPGFLKYFLDTVTFQVPKTGIPQLTIPMICKYKLPVPPLEVQREIVRILDSFTFLTAELTAKLTAELAARQKQYEFYRDNLLNFSDIQACDTSRSKLLEKLMSEFCPAGVKYNKLDTVCSIYDGTHTTPKYTEQGVKFASVENIADPFKSKKYISMSDYEKYKIKPQLGDILMTRIGSIGVCTVIEQEEPLAYYVSLALLRPDKKVYNSKFLKYAIESLHGRKELRKRTLINAVPIKINKDDIGKIHLPVPPLEVQQRIVDILDRFDALCNDITSGLPAETEARKKQYEYYRDKLLTFKELKKEA